MSQPLDRALQTRLNDKLKAVERALDSAVVGHKVTKLMLLTALAAGGNVLLQAVPGLAKTRLVNVLKAAILVAFTRIQMTKDITPSDILGTVVFNPKTGEFEYKPGPILGMVLILLDELNRAPEKTQAALLQAMEEGFITIRGVRYDLASPCMCLATQNPYDQRGVYELIEALVDRFCFSIGMDHVSEQDETDMLAMDLDRLPEAVMAEEDIVALQAEVRQLAKSASEAVRNYIVRLCRATRPGNQCFAALHAGKTDELRNKVLFGAGPRCEIWTLRTAAAVAYRAGRDFIDYRDVQDVFLYVARHRIGMTAEGIMDKFSVDEFIRYIIELVPIKRPAK